MPQEKVHVDRVVVKDGDTNRRRIILSANDPGITVRSPGEVLEGDVGTSTSADTRTDIGPAVVVLSSDVFGPPGKGSTRLENGLVRLSAQTGSGELELDSGRIIIRREPGPVSTMRAGHLDMGDDSGGQTVEINAESGRLRMAKPGAGITVELDAGNANLALGGRGEDGDLVLLERSGEITIGLNGASGNAVLGGHGTDGDLRLLAPDGDETTRLDGERGRGTFGGGGRDGSLRIRASNGAVRLVIDGDSVEGWPVADGEAPVSTLDLVAELREIKQMLLDLDARVAALEA